jgi:hypothetical protein
VSDPSLYSVWRARVTFLADRGGDAMGYLEVTLTFDSPEQGSPEYEALMTLWRAYAAKAEAIAREKGTGDLWLG